MKTVKNVKNSLKFRAEQREGALTVRLGTKKYVLPVTARLLRGENYLFLSIPGSTEIYALDDKALRPLEDTADGTAVLEELKPTRVKRSRKPGRSVDLPEELKKALSNVPDGYRLSYGPNNEPRLVRTRVRRKKD